MKWGISLTNCASFNFASGALNVKIRNNMLTMNPVDSKKRYAIKAEACDRIEIYENTISQSNLPVEGDVLKVVGISIRKTQAAKIMDNYMYRMGSGIMTNGAVYNNQYFCNTFSHNVNGFYFGDKTGLTNFGWMNITNETDFNPHNKWMYNIGLKVKNHNIISPLVNYYYYDQNWTGYTIEFDPEITLNSNPDAYSKILPFVNNNATFYCSNSSGPINIINDDQISSDYQRDELLNEYLEGVEYATLQEAYRSYEMEYLYDLLDNNQDIMWLGSGDDSEYQDFYAEVQNSVLGYFIQIDAYIAEGSFDDAYILNNQITPSNIWEENRQTANRIYLETYIFDDYELSENTLDQLEAIAEQTPYEGGYGVYTARVMLDYDADENNIAWRIAQTDQTSRNETQVRIFPNPVKETLYIEVLNDLESYVATVQIFNTLGQLIFNDQLSHKMESIDLSSLQIGLYIYTIQYETGHSEKGKFVINR